MLPAIRRVGVMLVARGMPVFECVCVYVCALCVCVGGGDFFYHLNVYSCYPLHSVIMQCTCACKQQLLAA